jgi:ketosteroid isomerase-like protein
MKDGLARYSPIITRSANMRGFAGVLVLLALSRPAFGQVVGDTAEGRLIALEQEWNDAILRNDRGAAGVFMAEEWFEITSEGSVLSKTEDLDELVGGYHATSLLLSDLQVHRFGDAAVVSGVTDETSSYQGRDTGGRFRWMDVWIRRAGRWVCVSSSVTRITAR